MLVQSVRTGISDAQVGSGHPPFNTTFGSLLACVSESAEATGPCKAIGLSVEKIQ